MDYDLAALQTVRETRFLIDRYDSWLFEEFQSYLGQRILEIGCGLGNQLRHLLDRELVVGIDVSESSVSEMRAQFVDHANIMAYCMSITEPEVLQLAHHGFDTALSLNVFEHIENDELALRNTWSLLRPGGTLILVVPAHEWLYGAMDRSIGHYRRYTKASMTGKMVGAGFEVIDQKYMNMLGALGWLVNGRLLGRRVPPEGQLKTLNLVMPIVEASERLFAPPFGVSLLTVARKQA